MKRATLPLEGDGGETELEDDGGETELEDDDGETELEDDEYGLTQVLVTR